jgi:hypothetical protein
MLSDLRAHVIADAAVMAMVGDRMFPVKLPQNVLYPALSYNQVSGVRTYDLCGPTGRVRPRITINSWAETYADARDLAHAVRKAIEGFTGTMGGSPGTPIANVTLDNEVDLDEPEAGLVGVFRVMQDYLLSYEED